MILNDLALPPSLLTQLLLTVLKVIDRRKLGAQAFICCFTDDFLSAPAINPFCCPIPTLDAKFQISDDHSITHVFLQAGMIPKLTLFLFSLRNVIDRTY